MQELVSRYTEAVVANCMVHGHGTTLQIHEYCDNLCSRDYCFRVLFQGYMRCAHFLCCILALGKTHIKGRFETLGLLEIQKTSVKIEHD